MRRVMLVGARFLAAGIVAASGAAGAQNADGEKAFKKFCVACHTVEAGKNKVGPSLAGIVGRKAGTVPGFSYSDANKNSGVVWDEATLDAYLTDPRKAMPGTKMIFVGMKNAEERKAVIAYLKQQK